MLPCTSPLRGGSERGARSGVLSSTQAASHVPQYEVPPSHSSENNELSARLSSATPSTARGVGPAASFRISQISLSVRILNAVSRAVPMDSLAASNNPHILRESRPP